MIIEQNKNKIITFFSTISQLTLYIYEKMAIIIQIGTEPNSGLHTLAAHGIPNEENPASHHEGISEDGYPDGHLYGQTDLTLSNIP